MAQSLVEATAAEAATVTALLHETMPDAQVTRVQRNQNPVLYRQ